MRCILEKTEKAFAREVIFEQRPKRKEGNDHGPSRGVCPGQEEDQVQRSLSETSLPPSRNRGEAGAECGESSTG